MARKEHLATRTHGFRVVEVGGCTGIEGPFGVPIASSVTALLRYIAVKPPLEERGLLLCAIRDSNPGPTD